MIHDQNFSLEDAGIIEAEDSSCSVTITQPFSPNDIRLSTPPMNMGDIIDMIQYRYIHFDADYQREQNLWSDVQQSRLIESVLLGLRLPAFYFEEVSKKNWQIIDGLQRCCSIRNFCVDGTLVLTGLEFLTEFNGKKYEDFPFDVKRDIRMLPVTINVLEKGVPDKVKYILFKRLNTGGINLSPQEIRNAVFSGKAIDLVKEMASNTAFLRATQGKIASTRKQDQDFISRFIAFYLVDYKDYEPDLDNFINGVMHNINEGIYDKCLPKMKSDFTMAMNLAFELFEEDAFRRREYLNSKRSPINKAYFEVISVCLSHLSFNMIKKLKNHKEYLIRNAIEAMHLDKSYNNSFSRGTANKEAVYKRFNTFETILNFSLQGKLLSTNI